MKMMFNDMLKVAARNVFNIQGWRTKRKIVVFESDDWGSIRMPDKATYNKLLSYGIRVDNCPYNKYDSLASEDDLEALFEVLNRYRDKMGNPPVITANCVMANPDFIKIRDSGFKEYHYELFTETLKKYPRHSRSFNYWKQGIKNRFFRPQSHGREHLNVARWMKALDLNLPETRFAFDLNLFGISTTITSEKRKSYLEAFGVDELYEENQINSIIAEGLLLFKRIIGYTSKSFIAPNYTWSFKIEKELLKHGIKYIQGQRKQYLTAADSVKVMMIPHYTGQMNEYGQIYTVRNCQFEPSFYYGKDNVDECLAQINSAFRWGKPAIITSHRVNYIGSIEISNRDRSLRQFNDLLSKIKERWPEVEFISTDRLGDLIISEKYKNDE